MRKPIKVLLVLCWIAPNLYAQTGGTDVTVTNTDPQAFIPPATEQSFISNDWQYGHDFARNVDQFTMTTMFGRGNNKLQIFTNQGQFTRGTLTSTDVDIFAWHLLGGSWAIKGGPNYSYKPTAYWQPGAGVEGTLPLSIVTNIRSYWHDGSGDVTLNLSRNIPLIGNWLLFTGLQAVAATQSVDKEQIGQGFNNIQYTVGPSYQLFSSLALQLQYQYTRNYGDTASILKADGQGPTSSLLTVGLEAVF